MRQDLVNFRRKQKYNVKQLVIKNEYNNDDSYIWWCHIYQIAVATINQQIATKISNITLLWKINIYLSIYHFQNWRICLLQFSSAMELPLQPNLTAQKEFELYKPLHLKTKKSKKNQRNTSLSKKNQQYSNFSYRINEKCKEIQANILQNEIQHCVKQIVELLSSQLNSKTSTIITVQFSLEQQQDLQQFIQQFQYLAELILQKCLIKISTETEVRDIALKLYTTLKQTQAKKFENVMLVIKQVADINQNNFHLIQKGLEGKHFFLVVPTFTNFEPYLAERGSGWDIQAFHYNFYDSKKLFCSFMMKCLQKQQIKGYLPAEAVTLITDFENYPISFHEACRRLIYCIEKKFLITRAQNEFVNFKGLIHMIVDTLKKFVHQSNDFSQQQFIKIILCPQSYEFKINEQLIFQIDYHLQLIQQRKIGQNKIDKEKVIDYIRDLFLDKLKKNEELKQLVKQFIQFQCKKNTKIPKNKGKKEEIGPGQLTYRTKKEKLEKTINHIILKKTQKIREQGRIITWNQLKLQQRICPKIPYDIVTKAKTYHRNYSIVLNLVLSRYSTTMTEVKEQFQIQDIQLEDGELRYILTDLQILGILQKNSKSSRMSFLTNYFDVAVYNKQKKSL